MLPLKWITGSLELLLAIPIVGAAIVIGGHWIPLAVMFILHTVTLIVTAKNEGKYGSSILGMVTSCVAWIPFVGWILHLITAILIMISAATANRKKGPTQVINIYASNPNQVVESPPSDSP